MSDVQAAFIYAHLDLFETMITAHVSLYEGMTQEVMQLNIGIQTFPNFSSETPFTSCFPVLFKQPIAESLVKSVATQKNIEIRKYYKPLLGTRDLAPVSHYLYDHIVCFPCHSQIKNEHIHKLLDIIKELHNKSVLSRMEH